MFIKSHLPLTLLLLFELEPTNKRTLKTLKNPGTENVPGENQTLNY